MTLTNKILQALGCGVARKGMIVMERVPRAEIAKRIGVEPEEIIRTINNMMSEGIIDGNHSKLSDPVYWRKGRWYV